MDSEKTVFGEKLLDPRWQALEARVIQDAEGFCQACGNTTGELQAHFFQYTAVDPWDEDSSNLTALCGRCHLLEHNVRSTAERHLLNSLEQLKFLAVDVLELVEFVVVNFQPRHSRMLADRLRRIRLVQDELSAEPIIAELGERIRKALENFAQRLKDGRSSDSEEFHALQREMTELVHERRRRAETLESVEGSMAPPDEITFRSLRNPRISGTRSGVE